MDLLDLFARIFMDTSDYDKGVSNSSKKAESFGSKLKNGLGKAAKISAAAVAAVTTATVALGGAIIKGTGEIAAHGDEVDKMSQKLGLSAKAYQEWDYVLSQSGTDITSMTTGLKTLTNKLDDAKNGGKDAQAMFAQLGISLEDLGTMSREDIFEATIRGFQNMEDSTERAALANDLFGKSGQNLTPLFNATAESTEALRKAANELGFVMSDDAVKAAADYEDALDTLKRTFGGLKQRMMGDFMPSITKVMEGLSSIFAGDDGGIEKLNEGISGFANNLSAIAPKLITLGANIVNTLLTAITDNLPELFGAGLEALRILAQGILDNLPQLIKSAVEIIKMIAENLLAPKNVTLLVNAALDILLALADGMIEALPIIIDSISQVIITICERLSEPDTIMQLMDAAWQIIKALAEGIVRNIGAVVSAIGQVLNGIFVAIGQKLQPLLQKGKEIVQKIGEGIKSMFSNLAARGREIISNIVSGIRNAISSVVSIGRNIVEGIWNGISNGLGWIKDRITGWVGNVLGFIKRLFKISSPSKVMRDEVGKFLAQGIGVGFVDEMGRVEQMMKDSMPALDGFLGDDSEYIVTTDDFSTGSGYRRNAEAGLLEEVIGLLQDIRANMGHDIVLSDGTLAGRMDVILGRRALQRARGNA